MTKKWNGTERRVSRSTERTRVGPISRASFFQRIRFTRSSIDQTLGKNTSMPTLGRVGFARKAGKKVAEKKYIYYKKVFF